MRLAAACATGSTSTGSLAAERVRLLSQDDAARARPPAATPRSCAPRPPRPASRRQPCSPRSREATDRARGRRRRPRRRPSRRTPRSSSAWPALARAAADRREGLAKLAGQVGARRSRIEAGEAEIGRLREHRRAAARPGPPRPSRSSPRLEASRRRRRGGRGGPRRRLREGRRPPRRRPRPSSSGCQRGRARRRARPHQSATARSRPSS